MLPVFISLSFFTSFTPCLPSLCHLPPPLLLFSLYPLLSLFYFPLDDFSPSLSLSLSCPSSFHPLHTSFFPFLLSSPTFLYLLLSFSLSFSLSFFFLFSFLPDCTSFFPTFLLSVLLPSFQGLDLGFVFDLNLLSAVPPSLHGGGRGGGDLRGG